MGWDELRLQVLNSPFDEEQVQLLNQVLPKLSDSQRFWLGGYMSALNGQGSSDGTNVATLERPDNETKVATKEVTILYGSQTGNCQNLAEELTEKLKQQQFDVTLTSMHQFKPNTLKKIEHLVIIISTHGEGDPPDTAIPFHEFLHGRRAPKLDNLHFSVLSLGDSSYEFFCQTGKDFDKKLKELGATPLVDRVDCDLDFDEDAAAWFQNVTTKLNERLASSSQVQSPLITSTQGEKTVYSRTNPFEAEVYENIKLNGRGSNKDTRHLEISLEGSNLQFEPGDSIGVYPKNDPALVDALLEEMGWDAEESVVLNTQGDLSALKRALTCHFEITVLTKPLLTKAVELSKNSKLKELLEPDNDESLREYISGRDLLDLVQDFGPWDGTVQDFIGLLRKIPPRLYSVANSLTANPEEAHLTVGTVHYSIDERERYGVCSGEFAHRIEPGDTIPVYVQKNANFALPENPEIPIIMIGPGTGVAPFRGFLEEREEQEAIGKSWLFFGDQHYVTDFMYQVEWQRWLNDGVLTKMDVAFSRDTDEKVYVQHKIAENSEELYQWIEEGAVIYVCGDEKHMAVDVHETLLSLIEKEGNKNREEADAFLTTLQQENRYQRDVY